MPDITPKTNQSELEQFFMQNIGVETPLVFLVRNIRTICGIAAVELINPAKNAISSKCINYQEISCPYINYYQIKINFRLVFAGNLCRFYIIFMQVHTLGHSFRAAADWAGHVEVIDCICKWFRT